MPRTNRITKTLAQAPPVPAVEPPTSPLLQYQSNPHPDDFAGGSVIQELSKLWPNVVRTDDSFLTGTNAEAVFPARRIFPPRTEHHHNRRKRSELQPGASHGA